MNLEDFIRYVGLLISSAGAAVAVPAATRRTAETVVARVRRAAEVVARFLGFRVTQRIQVSATAAGTSVGTATVTGWGVGEATGGTLQEQIDRLRSRLQALESRLNAAETHTREEVARLERLISDSRIAVERRIAELQVELQAQAEQATRTDAHALPLVVLGIGLSSLTGELARVDAVGLLVVTAACSYTMKVLVQADWRE